MTGPHGELTLAEYAERALLGVLLLDPARVAELSDDFTHDYFASRRNGAIFRSVRDDLMLELPSHEALVRYQQHPPDLSARAETVLSWAPALESAGVDTGYLTGLMALAPPGAGQPEVYSHLVLEASIRRDLTAAGLQVGQASTATPDLADMLHVIDNATAQVTAAQRRWEQITETRTIDSVLNTDTPAPHPADPSAGQIPHVPPGLPVTAAELRQAEETVVGRILRDPSFANAVLGRIDPIDFTDTELATAVRAATHVHANAATTGRNVDSVTVAWTQQQHTTEHTTGAPPARLHAITHAAEHADLENAVHVVMRSSLARMANAASEHAQHLAQQPDLDPGHLLTQTRSTYATVRAAAARMTGPGPTAHRIAARTPSAMGAPRPSIGDLTALRHSTTALLDGPATTELPATGADDSLADRLAPDLSLDEEVTPDASPEP